MARAKTTAIGFLIIPGNPGIGDYYFSLREELLARYPSSPIHVFSYKGFEINPPLRTYTILEEKDFLNQRISDVIKNSSRNIRWVVLGHSIGAWIALEVLNEWKDGKSPFFRRIHSAFLLFPFLALDPHSKKQKNLEKKLNSKILKHLVLACYSLLRLFPRNFLHRVLKRVTPGMDETARDINVNYFLNQKHIPASVIDCAKSEFATLERDIAEGEIIRKIKNINSIIYMFYARDDVWAPLYQMVSLQSALGKDFPRKIFLEEDLDHDFCVRKDQTVHMADRISRILQNFH